MGTSAEVLSSARLFLLLLLLWTVNAEKGSVLPANTQYEAGYIYKYHFNSDVSLHSNIRAATSLQVDLLVLSEKDQVQHLALTFSNLNLTWHTSDSSREDRPFEDISKWFSVFRDYSGHVQIIQYPQAERGSSVLSIKKMITQLISIEDESFASAGDSFIQNYVLNQSGAKKNCSKVYQFDASGCLKTVELSEYIIQDQSKGYTGFIDGLKSFNKLTLIGKELNQSPLPSIPIKLMNETLKSAHDQAVERVPLSSVYEGIVHLLSCSSTSSFCRKELIKSLRLLSSKDLKLLVKRIEGSFHSSSEILALIDALVMCDACNTTDLLTNTVLANKSQSDAVLQKTLHYFATSTLPVKENTVRVIKSMIDRRIISGLTKKKAFLTLGAIAMSVKDETPQLSHDIVDYLHKYLNSASPSLHDASVIDGIGNAGHKTSQSILHHYAKKDKRSHVQHAAIRALRHHHDTETADLLQDLAKGSSSGVVQHAAVSMYQKHHLAKRDVLTELKSKVQRSRRSAADAAAASEVYNTTMPPVHWSTAFGDDNITMNMDRTIHNQFSLSTDPYSTDYVLSMRDETSFTVDLQLSSGIQHNQFLRTELCLDGRVSYSTNMLTDFTIYGIRDQHSQFVVVINDLIQKFSLAYDAFVSSQSTYLSVTSRFSPALTSIESSFSQSSEYLSQFHSSIDSISDGIRFKNDINDLSLILNSTLSNIMISYTSTKQSVPASVGDLSYDLVSVLTPSGESFIQSTSYVPLLRFAPQEALANIYQLYWDTEKGLVQLESQVNSVKDVTGRLGSNKEWTDPSLRLWSLNDSITDVHDAILLRMNTNASEDNDLRLLSEAIVRYLQPALYALLDAPTPLYNARQSLIESFTATNSAFDLLTIAYEAARSSLDTIFGQVVHPGFPVSLKPCDETYGCGYYPSTTGGLYRDGIDLILEGEMIIAPFSGYVQLFDDSVLHNSSLYSYSPNNTIMITPTEFSMDSYTIIISNIVPSNVLSSSPLFIKGGMELGSASSLAGKPTIHIEAYKSTTEAPGTLYPQDPSQFLPQTVNPTASISWSCNEIATIINGVVVDLTTAVTNEPVQTLVGDPLVDFSIAHEFPQPYDIILKDNKTISSQTNVAFFESSTSLTVGPIPVSFTFTSTGHYMTNFSFESQFLSEELEVRLSPQVWSSVNGSMRVGSATFALVEIEGTLIDATLPLTIKQNFSTWPLTASCDMGLMTDNTRMNLTTKLAQLTGGGGGVSNEETLDFQVPWEYSIPYINRDEFEQTGSLADPFPPYFLTLAHRNNSYCHVEQLIERKYHNPAFELEFRISEGESITDKKYKVGTYPDGANVLPLTGLYGERIVLPHSLVQGPRLFFTVIAVNEDGDTTQAECQLSTYDSSPPLGSVVPVASFTSHLNQFLVFLSLFDEAQLLEEQEIAIGTEAGADGSDIVDWTTFELSLINTELPGTGLDLYSFPMRGRLVSDIITWHTDVDTPADCADLCTTDSLCLSFDHSLGQKRCVLHSTILGPSSDISGVPFLNSFSTESLKVFQDFYHYEKLGLGNSTMFTFSNLTLEHRRTFFVNMRLRDALGYTSVVSSAAVRVDLSPPFPGLILNAASDVLSNEACGFNIGQYCNEYGPTTPVDNHRIIVDGTGSATVFNGPIQLVDALYTKANTFMTANWDGFNDRESGLRSYTWCISSASNHTCDVIPPTDPHSGLSDQYWSHNGLAKTDLLDGEYYITVEAINGVGYGGSMVTTVHHSVPYIVDTQPPVIGSFSVVYYDINSNILNVSFLISDAGSGVHQVRIGVGRTPDDVNIFPWALVTSDRDNVLNTESIEVYIPDGVNGWVKLQVTDNVGLREGMTVSEPINIDRTPPLVGTVYDAGIHDRSNVAGDINYQSNDSHICVSWSGFSDPESLIVSYQWSIGSSPGSENLLQLQNLTDDEVRERSACEDVVLSHGMTYYSTLLVTNGAEPPLSSMGYSNGITIDTSPPIAGTVTDGGSPSGGDIDFSNSLTDASFHWSGFNDPQSLIQQYTVHIYRQPLNSMEPIIIHSETIEDGSISSYSSNHFSFSAGDRVYATIVAVNHAGLSVNGSSNGSRIDVTPPVLTSLVDGLQEGSDISYQSSTQTLSVTGSATDDESSIVQVEVAYFRVLEGIKTRVFPDPDLEDDPTYVLPSLSISHTATGLSLVNGAKYIASVTLRNGAGLSSTYETDGVFIDSSPPVVTLVTVYGSMSNEDPVSTSPTELRVDWYGSDIGSGIIQYLVSVLNEDGSVAVPSIDYGGSEGSLITGLNLTEGSSASGPFYKVSVVAVDGANLSSVAVESNSFWVNAQDPVGIVQDGFDPQVDVDFVDEYYSVTAHFRGFFSEDCGGFSDYMWSVGTLEDREAVLPFTREGIVLTSEGAGSAQIYLPGLESFDSTLLLVTFRGITGCGSTFDSVSDGFIIYKSPPFLSIIETGPFSIENLLIADAERSHDTYQSLTSFSSLFEVNGSLIGEGGVGRGQEIESVRVKVGSYPRGDDLMNETDALGGGGEGVSRYYIRDELRGGEGVPNYVTVTAINSAGLLSEAISEPLVLDTSLPPKGKITCSEILKSSCTDTTPVSSIQLICQWTGTIDLQSPIQGHTLSISTDQSDHSKILSREIPGNEQSFVSPVLSARTSSVYYATLYVRNEAGLTNILSTSISSECNSTGPIGAGAVSVRPNIASGGYDGETVTDKVIDWSSSAVCLWNTNSLLISFSPFTGDEISEYQLGIGTYPSAGDVLNFSSISPYLQSGSYEYQLDLLTINSDIRGPVYFTIRAFNARDQYADINSDPIYIKSDSNSISSMVYDGPDPQLDIDFQPSLAYYSGSFHYGVNCPLKSLQWGLEGADGLMVKNMSDVSLVDSGELETLFTFSSNQVDLHNDETYRIVVRGVDHTDVVHIFRSNGSGATLQQLQPGSVSDVSSLDLRYQEPLTSISFRISGFGDGSPEQEVSYYEAAVGSNSEYSSTRSDIIPFTYIGLNTSHAFTGLNLVSQSQTYYVTVRAHSVSGSVAQVTSNGFRPGYGSQILAGRIVQPLFQSNTTYLRVWWEGFQSDVPILSYEWAVSSRILNESLLSSFCDDFSDDHSDQFVHGFENIGTSSFAASTRLSLSHNVSYYVVLRVLDEASKCKAFISNSPTLIDTTPPNPPPTSTLVGPIESYSVSRDQYIAYIGSYQSLTLIWDQFTDFESSVESYSVGLFILESCGSEGFSLGPLVIDYVPVGQSTSHTFASLSLSPNVTYVARIQARNRAGLTSYKLSEPVMLDYYTLTSGTVKDGRDWSNDAVFQSDITSLSGIFSIAFSQPEYDEERRGLDANSPCPTSHYYSLSTPTSDWSSQPPSSTDGLLSSSIRYEAGQTSIEANGTRISVDIDTTRKQMVSGLYSTELNSSLEWNTVSLNIASNNGDSVLRPHMITSVLFIDAMSDSLLVAHDQPFSSSFKAVGLQLHHNHTNGQGSHIVLWSKDGSGSEVQSIARNVSLNLSETHRYKFRFTAETLGLSYRRSVELYIDDALYATLYGIPSFTDSVSMTLHMYNHNGYVIPCDSACASDTPQVYSIFSSVSVHKATGSVCDYGDPFYGWSAPIIRLEASVGTQPGSTDVKDFEVVYNPCLPCQPIPCYQYACNISCPGDDDPLTLSFTFAYTNEETELYSGSTPSNVPVPDEPVILSLPHTLSPTVYYINVKATSASGRTATSSSNGILIDVTPPSLSLPILHYDVAFSLTQPTNYQGNNHTVSASWGFYDDESGIAEYLWAIGMERFGEDIQEYTSVGLDNQAYNDSLEDILVPNTVYYVSVRARNGAGLTSTYSSSGITYLLIELNRTMLDLLVIVDHVDALTGIRLNGIIQTVFKGDREDSAGVEWTGTPPNISTVYWYIGSEPSQTDILPRLDVSYDDAHSALLRSGILYLDGLAFSNISDLTAIADGTDPSTTGPLYFEPGRPFFHKLEFCTFAHNCETSDPRAAIIIRQKDAQHESKLGEDISLSLYQINPLTTNASILDDNYTLIINTNGGLQTGTMLYAGFLSEADVTRSYRVNVPYISNPYTTIDQTSRSIARRLTGVGGPSFYVSLLGQDNLEGELAINVTFDTGLDWSESEPILVYWDIDESIWREVKSTCGTESKVDFMTGTISVDVCSTALPESDTSNRPVSLSRRRRETSSGDGMMMMNTTQVEFLDRATHFVVMQFGNLSLNTGPQLNLPTILSLNEDVTSFTFTIPYTDNEGDNVWFYLTSIPRLGSAVVDRSTGLLTYRPCQNCTGIDNLQLYIIERELEFGTELSDTGLLQLQVNNIDDPLDIFLYESTDPSNSSVSSTDSITVYVSANSTVPIVIASVGTYDVDGFDDDLEVYVTQGSNGASSYETWLDAVAVPESLPVDWGDSPVGAFKGYVSFLGVNVTYLPTHSSFTGTDDISVYSQQEDNTFSRFLRISIEVIPSWCLNGGVCNGSVSDPTCSDIDARKSSPGNYTCACQPGYDGDYCEIDLTTTPPATTTCPNNIPVFECGGNPCDGASCPGYPDALCVPDYCGHCHALWYAGGERVTCSAADPNVCKKPQTALAEPTCSTVDCPCPVEHYTCPQDSVFIETRSDLCCVTYSCQCPSISCPYLMECGHGLQPIPNYYGGRYPGRCCSEYSFEDIDECHDPNVKTCSDICINESPFFSCACPAGKTLASDGRTCGVCYHDGLQYLYGDTVKIGCNWCVCGSDKLSGERWSCTADSCVTGCYHNGSLYPPLSSILLPSTNCTCVLTDKSAEWSCALIL